MEPIRISSVTHAVPGKTLLHDLNLTLGEGRIAKRRSPQGDG